MLVKTASVMIVLVAIVAFGRISIAGTWIDDFSNPTNSDWGPIPAINKFSDGKFSVALNEGYFEFRGKKQNANLSLRNWSLGEVRDFSMEMRFMFRNIRVPEEIFWNIGLKAVNKETGEVEGMIKFMFTFTSGGVVEPNVASVYVNRHELEEDPQLGRAAWRPIAAEQALFAYEEKVWYTLKIERKGNRYTFWIDNFGLFTDDDTVPTGWITLNFVGRFIIWLDDFTVTGPDVPDGGPGVLGVNPVAEQLATTWGNLKMKK